MKELGRTTALFHWGLVFFSILPALCLFLIISSVTKGLLQPFSAALAAVLAFQVLAVLYRTGTVPNPMPLRLSYWTLKIMQSMHMIRRYTPEKMVVVMNNRRTLKGVRGEFSPERTLILLPHCLQNHECPIRLTFDPGACRRCGKCTIGRLLDIRDKYGTDLAIASGGTSARRIVEKTRPSLIVAVACPVDLSLGILDVHPITTVGVLNEWRNGPCFDTWVDTDELEAALRLFLGSA